MVLVNSLALKLAGVSRSTPDPTGGEIVRDPETGEPTGVLKDAAMDLVQRFIPPPSLTEMAEAAERALRHAAENGVTSVHDMADASSLEAYQEIERRSGLTARLSVYIPITEVGTVAALKLRSPFGGPYLKLAGLKAFSDGSLGSSTACFFEPYADDPSNSGLFNEQMFPEGIMEERIREADKADLQVAVHAIGDRANRTVLDIFERVMAAERSARQALEDRACPAPEAGGCRQVRQVGYNGLGPAVSPGGRRLLGREEDRRGEDRLGLRVQVAPRRRGTTHIRLGLDGGPALPRQGPSIPRSREGPWTGRTPAAGIRNRSSRSSRPSGPLPSTRPTPSSPSGTRARFGPAGSPTWSSSIGTSSRSRRKRSIKRRSS
jgi:Predicted metal-dependent hydrolase with the TIM-barrel fold